MTALPQEPVPRRARITVLVPLVLFLAVAGCSSIVSAPATHREFLRADRPGRRRRRSAAAAGALSATAGRCRDWRRRDFKGAVTLINVWASWCIPCHDEAPLLMRLAEDKRIRVVGFNYKDQPDNARRFLGRYGNRSWPRAPT